MPSRCFAFPYDYDQGEGFELNDSILLSQGQWPYRDNEVYPFYASNYPPLFHLMVIPLFSIFGPTLLAGRVLAFALSLLIAALVGWVVHAKTRDGPIAVISGLMVLASNFIYHVGPLFRQHLPMVLFELLAVIAISKYDDAKHGNRNIVLAMLALLAAGYTKQLAVITVAAVLVFLFLRSPKKSIVAGVGLAVVAGGIFLWMNIATQGQWFLNAITANANAYDYHQALDLFRQFFSLHFLIAALAIGYGIYELYWCSIERLHDLVRVFADHLGVVGQVGRGRELFFHGDCGGVRVIRFGNGEVEANATHQVAAPRPDRVSGDPPALSRAGVRRAPSAHRWPDLRRDCRSHRRGA